MKNEKINWEINMKDKRSRVEVKGSNFEQSDL